MVATDPEDLDPYLHASGPHRRGACYALPNLRSEEPDITIPLRPSAVTSIDPPSNEDVVRATEVNAVPGRATQDTG